MVPALAHGKVGGAETVGAGFRAGFEEKVCQGDQAKTGGTLAYSRTSVYESSTREYESLREKKLSRIEAIII